jgi:hypothetical protein
VNKETPFEAETRRWHRRFRVVSVISQYLGQGVSYEPGEWYTDTFTREEAQAYVDRLNAGKSSCWDVQQVDEEVEAT